MDEACKPQEHIVFLSLGWRQIVDCEFEKQTNGTECGLKFDALKVITESRLGTFQSQNQY